MSDLTPRRPLTLPEIMATYERTILLRALEAAGGSRSRAAASLGIRRERLYARLKFLKVDLSAVPARTGRPRRGVS